MTPQDDSTRLFTIGEFAQRSRLTTKALRVYDNLELLRPVEVDRSNGYRYYSADQLDTARLIGLLRGAGMSLNDIGQLLSTDQVEAAELLNRYLRDIESLHSSRRLLVRHIRTILRKEDHSMFSIQTRHVPSQRVMSIQRRLHAKETDAFIAEAKTAFLEQLNGAEPTGPFTVLFHGIVDHENDGPIEAMIGCPDDTQATDIIGVRTEPAHDEAYTTITKAEWAFPAILAAYDAVACSPEATARPGSRLSCREVYVAEPDEISDNELICDVTFPLG